MKLNYKHITIILSIIIHFIFVSSKIGYKWSEHAPKKQKKRIKLVLRSAKSKNPKNKMQIVENEHNQKRKKPIKSKFLSKLNQKYDRQTVSKNIGAFKKAGKGIKNGLKKNGASGKLKKVLAEKKKIKSKIKSKIFKKLSLKDLSMGSQTIKKITQKKSGQQKKGLRNGSLTKYGFATSNDFVEDLPLGDMTRLNTIEYKYYGFYHRIRQKLEQHWGNTLRKKADNLQRTGRRIASDSHKVTALTITLDSQGNIVDVFLKSTSGVQELDEAAIESFNKAGPFPNPPKGMMENGRTKIEWGFVVKS